MSDFDNSKSPPNNLSPPPPPPSPPPPSSSAVTDTKFSSANSKAPKYPNPPEAAIPDAATLREQWRFAIRQYSKWYSHAWGTAILAGGAFFALGWIIKGSNPLPSLQSPSSSSSSDANDHHLP